MLPSIFGENLFDAFFDDSFERNFWNQRRDKKDKQGRYIRQERYAGQCSRSFYVGDLKPEQIQAKYEDGILRLTLPKEDPKALPSPNRIEIQ